MDLNLVCLVDSCRLIVDSLKLFELWVAGLLSFIPPADVVRLCQHQFMKHQTWQVFTNLFKYYIDIIGKYDLLKMKKYNRIVIALWNKKYKNHGIN